MFSLGKTCVRVMPHFVLTEEGRGEKKINREGGKWGGFQGEGARAHRWGPDTGEEAEPGGDRRA